MITTASLNHHKAYYICQLLLELGVYVQIGVNPGQEMFQVILMLVLLTVLLIFLFAAVLLLSMECQVSIV